MKKVLLITVRSDFGGGPMHVNQLIEHLPQSISLSIACPKGEPYGAIWRKNTRLEDVIEIPFRAFSVVACIRLAKFVKKNNISLIHSHGRGAGIYSRLLKIFNPSITIIHTYHGLNDHQSKFKKIIYYTVEKFLGFYTDLSIFVSQGEKKIAEKHSLLNNNKKFEVIYNGVSLPTVRKEKFKNNDIFNIVTVTRFSYPKNMQSALNIAKCFANVPNIKFIWVGDGEDRISLEEESKELNLNIEFVGFSNEPYKYLQKSNIFLFTSLHEGLPYSLIESLSAGVPIVASNVEGNNEVVIDGVNGFLFESEEIAVALIRKIYNNRTLEDMLSDGALKSFKERFLLEEMITTLTRLYQNKLVV